MNKIIFNITQIFQISSTIDESSHLSRIFNRHARVKANERNLKRDGWSNKLIHRNRGNDKATSLLGLAVLWREE